MRRSISPGARVRYDRVPLPGFSEQKLLELLRSLSFASERGTRRDKGTKPQVVAHELNKLALTC